MTSTTRIHALEREVDELQEEVRLAQRGRGDSAENISATRAILTRKKLQLKQAMEQALSNNMPEWHREGCSGHNHPHR